MKLNKVIPWEKRENQLSRALDTDPFALLHREMNDLFADFIGSSLSAPSSRFGSFSDRFAPQIDLSETGEELRVTAELPGLDEKDIEVALEGNRLTLKGDKKDEHEEQKGGYYLKERSYGYFERSVQLPESVDPEKATAKFKKGVLEIAIPKKPEAQTTRKTIELQTD